jgi:flagellar hook-associated protein 1 FlgK
VWRAISIERFETPGLDTSLAPTAAGLFTDGGARSDPAMEQGLAARLTVNSAVRPEGGGAVWRLRDGIGATAEGATGNATLLAAQVDILSQNRTTASAAFSPTTRSMADLVSDHISTIGLARQGAEARRSACRNRAVRFATAGTVAWRRY